MAEQELDLFQFASRRVHNRAQVLRQSCGVSCWKPTFAVYFFTGC
jgi:hypothetical protein